MVWGEGRGTALLSSTKSGAESAIQAYESVNSRFGLTVNSSKTKHMVTGRLAEERDRDVIQVEGLSVFKNSTTFSLSSTL